MKPPEKFEQIVNRKRYNTQTAILLAGNDHWDGNNYERSGRNTFLYKTPKGNYFKVMLSQWQGEDDTLSPLSEGEAVSLFEHELSEHRVDYEEAFPNVKVEDA